MSWKATSYAKDVIVCPNGEKITRTEKLLLMVMADHHNTHQNSFFASNRLLAQESLLSVRQIQRVIKSMERKRLLCSENGLGRGNLTGYSFPWIEPKKGDTLTPLEELKGDISDTEKVTFQAPKGDISRHTHSKEVEQKSGTEQVEQSSTPTPSSPSAGSLPPNYDFGTFKSFYPYHRMSKHERAAKDEWNHLENDPGLKMAIIEHVIAMSAEPEWKKHGGKYVPNPQKYLAERYWLRPVPSQLNHRSQCEQILAMFIEISGIDPKLHKLTQARHEMLSARWDDALEKAAGHTEENAFKIMRGAVTAYCDYHAAKKLKSLMAVEKVFESTETMERWLAEACRED